VKGFEEYFLNLNVRSNMRNPWFIGKFTILLFSTITVLPLGKYVTDAIYVSKKCLSATFSKAKSCMNGNIHEKMHLYKYV